ncbi:TPA: GGDEF domain-containing protein [Candidatus Gastranaerophilales bacterium HUM_6]|nr:response regulator receiver modulated diguanylate cyclase [Fusobacterium sp. CAG:815]DAA91937.1 MAG TPA: GGDEF domain-containing protein [Candidatus Gastranaerophilales bacterium HUM_7]DAA92012.1 MAG TPA: GGDEF domain-containing protein [Candidatus Gastranaerophilales bacterium HUM_6]DAB00805.1 MAG TPA: GGDEF domain-containing protein [Candidatus Gastranaerophilales bacterium HUM_12]DAB08850.1 MAG TPA: GGDEF domain-containing protein [Candidatus Gastranaerophilales bacterium HUM_14]
MKNIVIYTDKNSSNLAEVISNIEDANVRLEDAANLKDYETLNPGVIIIESVPNIKDVLMVTKFKFPILFIGETFKGCTVRAVAFDYIKTPVDSQELVVRVKNMLKIRELREKLKTLATTDELTGLHNRKYLLERMDQEISRAKRYGNALSLLLFDLDFFKVVNDIYGYEWGDVLLKSIADKLKGLIRKEDILTRYGDEEFVVVLPNTSEDNAFLFAERFRKDIEKMEFIPAGEEERHPITISGGIATYPCLPDTEEDANTIIRYAEHALYNAKKRGKNKIVQFSQLNLGEG